MAVRTVCVVHLWPCWLPDDLEICEVFFPSMPCAFLLRLWATSKKMTFLDGRAALLVKEGLPPPFRTHRSVRIAGVNCTVCVAHAHIQLDDCNTYGPYVEGPGPTCKGRKKG